MFFDCPESKIKAFNIYNINILVNNQNVMIITDNNVISILKDDFINNL